MEDTAKYDSKYSADGRKRSVGPNVWKLKKY